MKSNDSKSNMTKKTTDAVEELSATLEELQASTEELRVQNEELEEARRALELERKRYQELFDLAPDGYFVTDCGGVIKESNEMAAALLGVTCERLVGKPLAVYVGSAFRPVLYQLLDTLAKQDADVVRDIELEIRPRKKNSFFSSLTIRVMRSAQGDAIGLRWLLRDISERRRHEKSLSETTQRLQRKNDELEQWASATAHDLKEPIRIMSLYSGMLQDKYRPLLTGEGELYLNFISSASIKAMSLIQDLLTYKSVTGRDKVFIPVGLVKPINQAIGDLRAALRESGAEINFGKLPTVMGDDAQLTQLFYNLFSNAIKFNKNKPQIDLTVEKNRTNWTIKVADNGIGFDPENSDRIFDMFERLDPPSFPGNGIGLALCKKIVENHGGTIWVETIPDKGSTFCFTLPVHIE